MATESDLDDRAHPEQHLNAPRVIVVLLRRPRRNRSDERREDPFWEVGSFGCTGCHGHNLMNPNRSHELDGAQFAFVQGGNKELRLVHVTPPILTKDLGPICEAVWSPAEMPLTYEAAPLVVDHEDRSEIPLLAELARNVRRRTPISKFASAFRSRRLPLAGKVGAQVVSVYGEFRKTGKIATSYEQAMPYAPPMIERDRIARYNQLRIRAATEATW